MAHVSTIISRTSITAPLRASPHRPTGAGSRRAAVTVRAGKGKGAQYRRGADDPYAKEKNKDKVEALPAAGDKENAQPNGAAGKKKMVDPDMEEEARMAAKLACSLANKDDCVMCGA